MKLPPGDTHFKPSDWDNYQRAQYDHALSLTAHRRTAIDCGAHVGIMTHRMCQDFQFTHAFEPQWHHYLESNMQNYTNWQLHACAVSNTRARLHLSVNQENTGTTHITDTATAYTVDVYTQTLDSFGFTEVDLIKIDVEGHELELLEGATQTITQQQPILLIELEKHSPQRSRVETLLKSWGYTQTLRQNADTVWRHQ